MTHSDVYGQALSDYFNNDVAPPLLLHNNYGEPEEMPIEVFFRDEDDLTDLEQYALHLCHGKTLDIGAGVGVHSLILQQELDVTALETSGKACEIMRKRGVREVCHQDIFYWQTDNRYDTLLLLMNGAGISGTRSNFTDFLHKLKSFLSDGGQIIIDSSDISYLYEEDLPSDRYFGEIKYQYEYKNVRGEWFPWLYLDQNALTTMAAACGFETQVVYQGNEDEYLAVLKVFS